MTIWQYRPQQTVAWKGSITEKRFYCVYSQIVEVLFITCSSAAKDKNETPWKPVCNRQLQKRHIFTQHSATTYSKGDSRTNSPTLLPGPCPGRRSPFLFLRRLCGWHSKSEFYIKLGDAYFTNHYKRNTIFKLCNYYTKIITKKLNPITFTHTIVLRSLFIFPNMPRSYSFLICAFTSFDYYANFDPIKSEGSQFINICCCLTSVAYENHTFL